MASRKRLLNEDVPKKTIWKYTLTSSTLNVTKEVESIELVRYNSIRDLFNMHKEDLISLEDLIDFGEDLMKIGGSQTISKRDIYFCVESFVVV